MMNILLHWQRKFQQSGVLIICVALLAWLSMLPRHSSAAPVGATNSISDWLKSGTIDWGIWGPETNGFCAGILLSSMPQGDPSAVNVNVYVLTSQTNGFWDYFLPPDGKFNTLELRNTNGVMLEPLGRKLAGRLPPFIDTRDLSMDWRHGVYKNLFPLVAGAPACLKEFKLQEAFRIKVEGDYQLTIGAAVYHIADDRKMVVRMDLPYVTTKVHLRP
jgi:hypothetical protein